jgi:tetraacyldisaccharide 4'-kinase
MERLVRRYNPKIPIFQSRVIPKQWIGLEWSTPHSLAEPPFRRVAAFCGLGEPAAFWKTLEELGLDIVFEWAFADHHSYRPGQIQRLARQAAAAGADALVTTEKDVMNLTASAIQMADPLKIYWLKIGVEIDREEELLRRIV